MKTTYVIMHHLELVPSNSLSSPLTNKTVQQLTSFWACSITRISSGGLGRVKIFNSLLIVFCAFMHPEYNS